MVYIYNLIYLHFTGVYGGVEGLSVSIIMVDNKIPTSRKKTVMAYKLTADD